MDKSERSHTTKHNIFWGTPMTLTQSILHLLNTVYGWLLKVLFCIIWYAGIIWETLVICLVWEKPLLKWTMDLEYGTL